MCGQVVQCKTERLLGFCHSFVILPESSGVIAQILVRDEVSRIALHPQHIGLGLLLQFAGRERVVVGGDMELFALAHPIPQGERLS